LQWSTERCDATSGLAQYTNVPYLKTFAFSEPVTAFLGGGVRGIIRNYE